MFEQKMCGNFLFHRWDGDGPFGKWFGRGFGPGGFGAARFERGDLKLIILSLLEDMPRHGYDIIQELEKKFHGFYSPSPGSVYPILQLLEDQDLVVSSQQSGKKTYTITDAGKQFLKENKEEIESMHSRVKHAWGMHHPEHLHELKDEVRETAHLIFSHAANGALKNPETRKKLKEAFRHFRDEVKKIFAEVGEKKSGEENE